MTLELPHACILSGDGIRGTEGRGLAVGINVSPSTMPVG